MNIPARAARAVPTFSLSSLSNLALMSIYEGLDPFSAGDEVFMDIVIREMAARGMGIKIGLGVFLSLPDVLSTDELAHLQEMAQ